MSTAVWNFINLRFSVKCIHLFRHSSCMAQSVVYVDIFNMELGLRYSDAIIRSFRRPVMGLLGITYHYSTIEPNGSRPRYRFILRCREDPRRTCLTRDELRRCINQTIIKQCERTNLEPLILLSLNLNEFEINILNGDYPFREDQTQLNSGSLSLL